MTLFGRTDDGSRKREIFTCGRFIVVPNIKRPFTLLDSMTLIMAAAIGLTLTRYPLGYFFQPASTTVKSVTTSRSGASFADTSIRQAVSAVARGSTLVYPLVFAFTIAALVLRFKRPRPQLRRIFRQPGTVGCFAATLSFVFAFLIYTPTTLHTLGDPRFNSWMLNVWLFTSRMTGVAVASAWLALALCGQWRSERTWVDRMGQLLAGSWIFAIVLEVASVWSTLL
jgi:hypothetical protein